MSAPTVLERYLTAHAAADTLTVVGLFSPGATLEDPVGDPPHVGIDAIRAFFRATHERQGRLRLEPIGPIIAGGAEAAVHVRASGADADPDVGPVFDVIYVLTVDPQRRITRLRAFFDLDAGAGA